MIKPETVAKQIAQERRILFGPRRHDLKVNRKGLTITFQLMPPPAEGWTSKDKEILQFIQAEFDKTLVIPVVKEIAAHFDRPEGAIKKQLSSIFQKASLQNFYQLVFVQIESSVA